MSDRELGERLGGYEQSSIAKAKSGKAMTDPLAIRIAEAIGVDPGEVLLVARAERERDEEVKQHLLRYAAKTLRLVPSKVVSVLGALAVALGALSSPQLADAHAGGKGD